MTLGAAIWLRSASPLVLAVILAAGRAACSCCVVVSLRCRTCVYVAAVTGCLGFLCGLQYLAHGGAELVAARLGGRHSPCVAVLLAFRCVSAGHDCCVESDASHRSCHTDKCTLPCGRPPMHSILPDAYVALHMHACSCILSCPALALQVCSGRVWPCLCYGCGYRFCGYVQPCV
jgi:hypothetical protein